MENGNGIRKQELLAEANELLTLSVAKLVDAGLGKLANRLSKVEIRFSDTLRKTAGTANYATGLVELSWAIFRNEDNAEGFIPTVYHELAHVASPVRGHGKEWKLVASFIGGDEAAKRTHRLKIGKPKDLPYPVLCEHCSKTFNVKPAQAAKMRKGSTYVHQACSFPIILKEETELEKLYRKKYKLEAQLETVLDKIADIETPEILPEGTEARS